MPTLPVFLVYMAITITYLETPAVVSLAANQVNVLVASSVTGMTNLFIHLEILKYEGAAWVGTGLEDAIPVVGGVASFDLAAYFSGILSQKFTFPEHFTNIAIPQPTMVVKYRMKAWETYTDATGVLIDKKAADSLIYNTDLFVTGGGISEDDQAILNTLSSNWWDEWITQKKFQSWMPGVKSTSPKSTEKLFWIARRTAAETIAIAWTGTDGTTGTVNVAAAMTAYMMYELCISPAIAEQLSGKELASYNVTITGQSETISYTIDRDYYENEEFFLMANAFGCYESLWCKAFREGEMAFDRIQYERSLGANYTLLDRKLGTTRANIIRTRKSNTGYFDGEEWYNWALALLAGESAWIYGENSLAPVVITTDKAAYINDLLDVWSLEFEWKHSREGRFGGNLGLIFEYILPPYWSKIAAFFYRIDRGSLTDMISGLTATVSGSNITWPNIAASDVLDFSDAIFWNSALVTGYNVATPRTVPLAFMQGWAWAEAATAATHARLFHKDYNSKIRDLLPVLLYNQDLSTAEQAVVVTWLNWYYTIMQNGSILKQGNNVIIQ